MTLQDLVGCSTTELLVVNMGQIVGGIDWNHIVRLHSHVLAHMNSLTSLGWLDHGGSWIQIPSGTRIFSESTCLLGFMYCHVVISLFKIVKYKTRTFNRKFKIKPIPILHNISLNANNHFWYCCLFFASDLMLNSTGYDI